MTDSIEDILQALNNTVTDNFTVPVWIPTINDIIYFKPISILQQKTLLKSVLNVRDIYNTEFITSFYDIIKSNCLDQDFNKLTKLDEFFIFLQLRININKELIYNENNIIFKKDLEQVLLEVKQDILNKDFFSSKNYQENNISIVCKIPSIQNYYECERDKEKINVEEDITEHIYKFIVNTISDELVKFIDKITINNKEYILTNFKYRERVEILNQLPASILDQAIKYVTAYKTYIENAMTIELININNNEDVLEFTIPYSGLFFIT